VLADDTSLFLDLDGTLVELIDRPDEVVADPALRTLLARLSEKLCGRIAVISGRSIEQLDAILGEIALELAVSGSHGCEHRWQGVSDRVSRPDTLDQAAERLHAFAADREGVLLEEKALGVALHYRMNEAAEADVLAMATRLGEELDLHVQNGKMMVELRVASGDKGGAIRRLMARAPMAGTTPVFIGDDLTDEPGFVAASKLGGYGILVGPPRESAAAYGLPDPAALRKWLAEALR